MNRIARSDDPRLSIPLCVSLTPVREIHENKWFAVKDRGGYFTVEYQHPQVIILPIVDNHSIVLVRVKRPILADNTLELPAGGARKGESALSAVAREFTEETGIVINDNTRFKPETPIANSPNRNPNLIHVYQINISQEEYDLRSAHDHEIESVDCYCFKELKKMVNSGEIYIGAPVAVISRYLLSKDFN